MAPKPTFKKTINTVFVTPILNKEIPIVLSANGNLVAKNKIELFSEVQGVLQTSNKAFKPGTVYVQNENLLSINSDEFNASLQSQKSNLFNLITSILPDIRLDFSSHSQFDGLLEAVLRTVRAIGVQVGTPQFRLDSEFQK